VNRLAAVGRALAKLAAWLLAGVLVLVAVWYVANRTLEPKIDDALVSAERIPDAENAGVALLGLTAPSGADFMEYGSRVKALYEANAPYSRILDELKGAKTLQPTVESAQTSCWLDPDWPVSDKCPPFEKAADAVRANRELLDRLRLAYSLKHYAGDEWQLRSVYLTLIKLSVADMQWDLRQGAHEAAYRKWSEQFRFVRMSVQGTDTWVGRAVGLVAMGVTIPVLENLLDADPDIARRHAAELLALVRPNGVAAFGPEGIVRGEYALLKRWLSRLGHEEPGSDDRLHWLVERLGQKNRILNRYARFAPDYARAMQAPWNELASEYERLREKHYEPQAWEFVVDPFGSVFFAEHIDSHLKIREMIRQMHYLDGKLRLATLVVRKINEGVGDTEMAQFLAKAGPELEDPFLGRPMRWDPKDRKIYMTDPDERCLVMAWFRLPAPRGAPRPSGSAVSTNAC
jgi:hypothetical protein